MLLDTGYDDLPFMGDKDGAEELKERKQEKAVEQEEFCLVSSLCKAAVKNRLTTLPVTIRIRLKMIFSFFFTD